MRLRETASPRIYLALERECKLRGWQIFCVEIFGVVLFVLLSSPLFSCYLYHRGNRMPFRFSSSYKRGRVICDKSSLADSCFFRVAIVFYLPHVGVLWQFKVLLCVLSCCKRRARSMDRYGTRTYHLPAVGVSD